MQMETGKEALVAEAMAMITGPDQPGAIRLPPKAPTAQRTADRVQAGRFGNGWMHVRGTAQRMIID